MRHHSPNCLNCGEATPGEYCGACGQRNVDLRASFWELLVDIVSEAFDLDSRMGRTIVPFLFKPGFLTNEHNAGRRVRYSSPVRIYLLASALFFLGLSLNVSRAKIKVVHVQLGAADGGNLTTAVQVAFAESERDAGAGDAGRLSADSGVGSQVGDAPDAKTSDAGPIPLDGGPDANLAPTESDHAKQPADEIGSAVGLIRPGATSFALVSHPVEDDFDGGSPAADGGSPDGGTAVTHSPPHFSPLARAVGVDQIYEHLNANMARLDAARGSDSHESDQLRRRMLEAMVENTPRLMFLLVPLVALLFKLFFRRRHAWYTEHLTLTFHLHAFAFLLLAATTLPIPESIDGPLTATAGLLSWLYTLLALRRVYSQSWVATIFKFFTLSFIYLVMLLFGLLAVVLLGVIQL